MPLAFRHGWALGFVLAAAAAGAESPPQATDGIAFDAMLAPLWRDGLGTDIAAAQRTLAGLEARMPPGDVDRRHAFEALACGAPHRNEAAALAKASALIEARAGAGDKGSLARLHLCRVARLPQHGDMSQGMADIETALSLARHEGDPVLVGDVLVVRGGAHSLAGRHAAGLIDVLDAQDLFEAAEDSARKERNLQAIGIAYRRMGEFAKAGEYLELSLENGLARGDWDQEFVALLQLGFLHQESGAQDQARVMFRRAIARADERDVPADRGLALLGLAGTEVLLRRPHAALQALLEAQAAFEAAGIDEDDPSIKLIEGDALAQLGRRTEALQRLDAAVDAFTPPGNERYLLLALLERSEVREAAGDASGSLSDLRRAYALHIEDDRQRAQQRSDLRRYEFDIARRDDENQQLRATEALKTRQLAALNATRRWQWGAMGLGSVVLAVIAARQLARVRRLRLLAMTDPLTGLANRRRTDYRGREAFKAARSSGQAYCVLVIDIDHFKKVNDAHGHAVGDSVLQRVGRECQRTLRKLDLMGRIGGEEFAGLLPETAEPAACQVAERLRAGVENLDLDDVVPGLRVTISLGVAQMRADDADFAALLARADAAMYRAKQAGRNRVVSDGTA